jgi:hypothetical protein
VISVRYMYVTGNKRSSLFQMQRLSGRSTTARRGPRKARVVPSVVPVCECKGCRAFGQGVHLGRLGQVSDILEGTYQFCLKTNHIIATKVILHQVIRRMG